MTISFEKTLIDVWRQVLVENAHIVVLDQKCYPVRLTSKRRLREVTLVIEGREIRGIVENPETKFRWAEMARVGVRVMQSARADIWQM
jgi:hypothetical protein